MNTNILEEYYHANPWHHNGDGQISFLPHIHVFGKRVHPYALVAYYSARCPRSVVLWKDVEDIPTTHQDRAIISWG